MRSVLAVRPDGDAFSFEALDRPAIHLDPKSRLPGDGEGLGFGVLLRGLTPRRPQRIPSRIIARDGNQRDHEAGATLTGLHVFNNWPEERRRKIACRDLPKRPDARMKNSSSLAEEPLPGRKPA